MQLEGILIKNAKSRSPFSIGLQYNPPARGVWNIANMAMLIPESHVIFVCPMGCMRGVTLTAAEMNTKHRFSAIFVTEQEILIGSEESLIINGVSEILDAMENKPKAVSIFTSCVDQFLGTDHKMVFQSLQEKYPHIEFIECFMTPTMRKGGLPPDPIMRRQLFSLLEPTHKKSKTVNFIGNNLPLPEENEIKQLIQRAGYKSLDLGNCRSFTEYKKMEESGLNIMIHPNGKKAVEELSNRLGIKNIQIPLTYHFSEMQENYKKLAEELGVKWTQQEEEILEKIKFRAEQTIKRVKDKLHKTPLSIDYTMTGRPFGLARQLLEFGFSVKEIYAESCLLEEEEDFLWLQKYGGELTWYYPMAPQMAMAERRERKEFLALGQVAAYFCNTPYFVNVVESDGMYGFHGLEELMKKMEEAVENEKDTSRLIQIKALGCCG
ncbi:MAG: nitrogenase component 1 [Acetivibrio sp.]